MFWSDCWFSSSIWSTFCSLLNFTGCLVEHGGEWISIIGRHIFWLLTPCSLPLLGPYMLGGHGLVSFVVNPSVFRFLGSLKPWEGLWETQANLFLQVQAQVHSSDTNQISSQRTLQGLDHFFEVVVGLHADCFVFLGW